MDARRRLTISVMRSRGRPRPTMQRSTPSPRRSPRPHPLDRAALDRAAPSSPRIRPLIGARGSRRPDRAPRSSRQGCAPAPRRGHDVMTCAYLAVPLRACAPSPPAGVALNRPPVRAHILGSALRVSDPRVTRSCATTGPMPIRVLGTGACSRAEHRTKNRSEAQADAGSHTPARGSTRVESIEHIMIPKLTNESSDEKLTNSRSPY
jgi:hypothetical protein